MLAALCCGSLRRLELSLGSRQSGADVAAIPYPIAPRRGSSIKPADGDNDEDCVKTKDDRDECGVAVYLS